MTRRMAVLAVVVVMGAGCAAPDGSMSEAAPAEAQAALALPAEAPPPAEQAPAPVDVLADLGDRPVVVIETERGTIEIELFADGAPQSVGQIVTLIGRNFYNGQRVHRVDEGSLIQFGDPQSRDMRRSALWGTQSSGNPIGVAEIIPSRSHVVGAVALAHPGDPRMADSQLYITMVPRPELDGDYAIIGQVTSGMDVVTQIEVGDRIDSISVAGQDSSLPAFQGLGQ
jgi:cyclophilin family peptidyl-prolyl cis-trans isomerase